MTGMESALRDLVLRLVREDAELRAALVAALADTKPAADRYLSTTEAAELANVAEGTIRRWIREGRIVGHRAGRVLRVRASDLERLLTTGVRAGKPARLSPEELARRDFGLREG